MRTVKFCKKHFALFAFARKGYLFNDPSLQAVGLTHQPEDALLLLPWHIYYLRRGPLAASVTLPGLAPTDARADFSSWEASPGGGSR
eukprot:9504089-Pyramimonas_sp.AAC.1